MSYAEQSPEAEAVAAARAHLAEADQACARAWVETGEVDVETFAAYAEARMRHQAAVDALSPAEFTHEVPF